MRKEFTNVSIRSFIYKLVTKLRKHGDGAPDRWDSIDQTPWSHPCLHSAFIEQFRLYSEQIWDVALKEYDPDKKLSVAFAVNMAQNMYKWARLNKKYGGDSTLYLHPQDRTVLNLPQWEEYEGQYQELFDVPGFLEQNDNIPVDVTTRTIMEEISEEFREANDLFVRGQRRELLALLSRYKSLRRELFLHYPGTYPYFFWSAALSEHDVIYIASSPIAAYFSSRPYCAFSVGGDLQYDCGRGDWYGGLMTLAFDAARFMLISNPHSLGHSRRLGLTNGVYLPYPMDSDRYCPGEGNARRDWVDRMGDGVYVLSTSRLDKKVKGQGEEFFQAIAEAIRHRPELRFVFLQWGESAHEMTQYVQEAGIGANVLVLPPAGKKRLIDYYRSCDVMLDSMVYGYYGATALEAASIGKPVIMKLRTEHYEPLYKGDVMPAENVESPAQIVEALIHLVDSAEYRDKKSKDMRGWLVRNHGEQRTVPLMQALLQMAAYRKMLPVELDNNPLGAGLTEQEIEYHQNCQVPFAR